MKYSLIIDTSTHPARLFSVGEGKVIEEREWENDAQTGIRLLENIEEVLGKHELQLRELERIGVHAGPGGYSSLRAGIATAQALGLAAGVAVVPITGSSVEDMVRELQENEPVEIVEAEYR